MPWHLWQLKRDAWGEKPKFNKAGFDKNNSFELQIHFRSPDAGTLPESSLPLAITSQFIQAVSAFIDP